jgi:hypothetical protein
LLGLFFLVLALPVAELEDPILDFLAPDLRFLAVLLVFEDLPRDFLFFSYSLAN